MRISVLKNEGDNFPVAIELTEEEFIDSLTTVESVPCTLADCLSVHPVEGSDGCPHKKQSAWVPACWPEGAIREKATVEYVSVFVADVDHRKQQEYDGILERIAPYKHVLHSSHSDRPEDRCGRIILFVSRPITGKEFPRFWPAVVKFLNIPADEQTKDSSRLYFLPTRPSDACHDAWDGSGFDFAVNEGKLLDVDAILALAPPVVEHVRVPVVADFKGSPTEKQFEDAVEILGACWPPHGKRHGAQRPLSGALARVGWPVELIADFCAAVAERSETGTGDLSKRLKSARASVEKLAAGDPVDGWPTLIEEIGEEPVNKAREALGLAIVVNTELKNKLEVRAKQNTERRKKAETSSRKGMTERVPTPTEPPTREKQKTAFEGLAKDLKKSKDVDRRYDGKLLTRALKGQRLTEHLDEDLRLALEQTAVVMARGLLPGATAQYVSELLSPIAGKHSSDAPQIAAWAMEQASAIGPIEVPGPRAFAEQDEKEEPEDDTALRFQLEMTDKGDVKNCPHNIDRVLQYASELRGNLRFNVITRQVEVVGGRFSEETANDLPIGILNWLGSHWSLSTSTEKVVEQLLRIARMNSYDPVQEYLEGLEWDGVSRIGSKDSASWLHTYCQAEDTLFARKVGAKFLISAVARGLAPGSKVDSVLILEGAQGAKKSTSFAVLGGKWFSDTPLVLGDKDSMVMASSKWLVELAELDSLTRVAGEYTKHKAFLSAAIDNLRPPYGRVPEEFKRHCVFGGTVNESEYLEDPTGNRRYWAVKVGACQVELLAQDRDQLWAEAVVRYKSAHLNLDEAHPRAPGERWWFDATEQVGVDLEMQSRRHESPWVYMIQVWAARLLKPGAGAKPPVQHFQLHQVMEEALDISPVDMQRYVKPVTRALRDAGFVSVPVDGGPQRAWVKEGSVAHLRQQGVTISQSETSVPSDSN